MRERDDPEGICRCREGYRCAACRTLAMEQRKKTAPPALTAADEARVQAYLAATGRVGVRVEFARKVLADLEGYDSDCFDEVTWEAFRALRKRFAPLPATLAALPAEKETK